MATKPVDPLSPEALDAENTYPKAVRDRMAYMLRTGAQGVGNFFLGSGTEKDGTAAGTEYKKYQAECQAMGNKCVSPAEFAQGKR